MLLGANSSHDFVYMKLSSQGTEALGEKAAENKIDETVEA